MENKDCLYVDVGARKFSLDGVSKILDVPQRHVSYLVEMKVVTPSYNGCGKGSKRMFGVSNLMEVAIASSLTTIGVKAAVCTRLMESLRGSGYLYRLGNKHREEEPQYAVIDNREHVHLILEWSRAMICLRHGSAVVVDLSEIEKKVANAIQGTQVLC